jgi:hypothetical protein
MPRRAEEGVSSGLPFAVASTRSPPSNGLRGFTPSEMTERAVGPGGWVQQMFQQLESPQTRTAQGESHSGWSCGVQNALCRYSAIATCAIGTGHPPAAMRRPAGTSSGRSLAWFCDCLLTGRWERIRRRGTVAFATPTTPSAERPGRCLVICPTRCVPRGGSVSTWGAGAFQARGRTDTSYHRRRMRNEGAIPSYVRKKIAPVD